MTFPVAPAPAGHEGTGLAGGEPVALHGVRVLVVDDHADARELMRTMLEAHGAAVTLAEGAGSAAQALAGARFDVLVSDVGMPGVDGFALLSGLRRRGEEHVRDVPAIAVSAYAGDAARGKALAAGFDQYLTKPLDAVRLASAVSAVTRMRRISNADHADGLETRNTRI